MWVLAGALLLGACRKPEPIPPRGEYDGGYFVLNEGQFMHANATVGFVTEDLSEYEDSVYYKVNREQLGDVAQSMFLNDDKAYIVVNNSHQVVVADRWDMTKLGIMRAFIRSPRYMVKVNDRLAVLSNWGEVIGSNGGDVADDYLAFVDLENDVVTDTLHIDVGPEKMVYTGGKLYVLIKGVMSPGRKVAVVDPSAKEILHYIELSTERPADIAVDDEGYIWVITSGTAWGNPTPGGIYKINPATDQVEYEEVFSFDFHPRFLEYSDGYLYYLANNTVFKFSASDPSNTVYTLDLYGMVDYPYGMDIHDNNLFITDATDFSSPGKVIVADKESLDIRTEFTAGLLPNGVYPNF